MVKLPFIPVPYPDEILGSWLWRTALYNRAGGWKTLLSECGFTSFRSIPFDFLKINNRLENLLSSLGMNMGDAMLNLTTLPFFTSFQAFAPDIENHSCLPYPRLQKLNSPKNVSHTVNDQFHKKNRLCPRCVEDDHDRYGAPYWHLSHQVPTVSYCPVHHCRLITHCPNCHKPFGVNLAAETHPIGLTCSCGLDLRAIASCHSQSDFFAKVQRISLDALSNRQFNKSYTQNKRFIGWHLINIKKFPSSNAGYNKFLTDFNNQLEKTPVAGSLLIHDSLGSSRFRIDAAWERCSVSSIIATMAHYDLSFHDLHSAVDQPPLTARHFISDKSRESLRAAFLIWKSRYPQTNPHHFVHYWHVRLKHNDILTELYPNNWNHPDPTIAEDRESALRIIKECNALSKNVKTALRKHRILQARLKCRDENWLQDQLLNNDSRADLIKKRIKLDDASELKILAALKSILEMDGKPQYPSYTLITSATALSKGILARLANTRPTIQQALDNAQTSYRYRLCFWAASQLYAASSVVSYRNVLDFTGISKIYKGFAKRAVLDYIQSRQLMPHQFKMPTDAPPMSLLVEKALANNHRYCRRDRNVENFE